MPHGVRKFDPVHRARHVHIGEHYSDVVSALQDPDRFVGALTQKLLMYATGRNVQYYDLPAVREIVRQAAKDNYQFSSLVLGVAESVPFQMRQSQPAENQP